LTKEQATQRYCEHIAQKMKSYRDNIGNRRIAPVENRAIVAERMGSLRGSVKERIRRCLRWTIYVELASLTVGLFFFIGSLHSGGPGLYASAIFVPPLFLVIFGLLRSDSFLMMVITVAALQFPVALLAAFVVVTVRDSHRLRRKGNGCR
jgi:hypothetical protein